ncbi:MDR family MFS transporter [Nocardiopsis sp. B62]|uniref:MDR family MFS transporter n=1 Tax=Nocardiopsis sp. B62 TaxID=2824874 RepID=UPI001B35955C|nr:MDR family MFS transporter [Nocardiopsis sp. B62]MBQ1079940.1 multidrug efflux MFS transporter [Nocardiopsis sp. B62]
MLGQKRPAGESVEDTPAASQGLPRELVLVLGLLLAGAFVMILNETIMSVALPTLMAEFSIEAATAQWLTTGFLLTMAVVIPTTGLILQRFATRTVFVAALALFTLGTALCAIAPTFPLLVAGRIVQAAGTAIVLPLLMTTVMTLVPVSRRGRTMGLISIVIAVAPAVGPTYSGFVLDSLGWRWMFITVFPVAIIVLVVGAVMVKDFSTRTPTRLDVLSLILSALGFGGLVYGLSSLGKSAGSASSAVATGVLVVGVLTLGLFVWRQLVLQRGGRALLDLRPFRVRTFTVGLTMMMVSMSALFGTLILLPLYLQDVRALDTLQTGLILLPGGVAMGLVAPFVGRAFDRVGPRPLVIPGAFGIALALGGMVVLDGSSSLTQVIATHIVLHISLGLVMTPLMTASLGSLPPELYSHGSAIMNTLQQLAGAAGTALFITVMTAAASKSAQAGAATAAMEGINAAFLVGAVLAGAAALLSFTVRSSATTGSAPAAGLH